MSNAIIEAIVEGMGLEGQLSDVQRIQTEHRIKLVRFWEIKEGSRILEIGCGQGDTTAVLAHFAGEQGFVHGVDIAPPGYGSPMTVGEAAAKLKASPLGSRIRMDYGIDVLSDEVSFAENEFDYVVLSHCSWYLKSFEELAAILAKVRGWARKLCFAEWDMEIEQPEQLAHFMAVLIQSQVECYKVNSFSNVRTLFTPEDIRELAAGAGWAIARQAAIHSPEMHDARWEMALTLAEAPAELDSPLPMPDKAKQLVRSQLKLLRSYAEAGRPVRPMAVHAFVADQSAKG
ncbi:class I SAM-dependent methyltransferase [Paenibacillus sp. D51F]